jgi:hypothetical protein
MGYVPILIARNAEQALAWYGPRWMRELRGRRSWLPWRRRRAYAACRALIRAREASLGMAEDPWLPQAPPKPDDARRSVEVRRGRAAA